MQWESAQRKAKIEAITPKKDKNFKEANDVFESVTHSEIISKISNKS